MESVIIVSLFTHLILLSFHSLGPGLPGACSWGGKRPGKDQSVDIGEEKRKSGQLLPGRPHKASSRSVWNQK